MMENLIGMNSFNDKVVLVTGSSRGIGAAIAREFAKHGAKVVLHGRDKIALAEAERIISESGGKVMIAVADLNNFDEIEAMRQQIEKTFGQLDILIANAGGSFTPPAPLEEISLEGWHASIEGNLTVTFLTFKSFLPGMKERRSGSIITISSSAGRMPHAISPIPYGVAKAGIKMLTQDVAAQAGPYNIRVNCIAPETILTEKNQERIPADRQKAMIDAHPLKRLGSPDDVARAALFLCSDEASWVTGAVLDITGGAVLV
jgi:3-oxoacyl-[acyl-carrier protein] reductase